MTLACKTLLAGAMPDSLLLLLPLHVNIAATKADTL